MSSVWEHPDTRAWIQHVRESLVPAMADSGVAAMLVTPGAVRDADVTFAVEIGMAILMDKPIIAVVSPGVRVPEHLVRVADAIIEGDLEDPAVARRLAEAARQLAEGELSQPEPGGVTGLTEQESAGFWDAIEGKEPRS